MEKCIVVINEQHEMLQSQVDKVKRIFLDFEYFRVPATGLTRKEIFKQVANWIFMAEEDELTIVFVSPIPLMIGLCASEPSFITGIFHNDKRVAKEVPDGKGGVKVIHAVAPDGWELIRIG